jgi:quinol monooxygenase YgiN
VICYLIKIRTKPYKKDEFVASVGSLSSRILKENGCIACNLYADSEQEDTFVVVSEWNIREAMDVHFQNENYEILIGSARVLGKSLEMTISEVVETGGSELAKEYVVLPKLVDNYSD